jgi:ATP-binding cassette, subfamily B, bacterial
MARALRLFWPIMRRQRAYLAALIVLAFALAGVTALYPWPLKILADYALGEAPLPAFIAALPGIGSPLSLIMLAAVASIALFAVRAALDAATRWLWALAGQRMVYKLAEEVFSNLIRLNATYHARHSPGDSLTRITTDAYCIYYVVQGLLTTPLQAVFTLGTVGVIAWQLDPLLAMTTFGVAPILAAAALVFGERIRSQSRNQVEAGAKIAGFVHQTLSVIPIVQAFGTTPRNQRQYRILSSDAVVHSTRSSLYKNVFGLTAGLVIAAGTGIVVYVGGVRALAGIITIGTLLVFMEYLRTIQGAFRQLLNVYAYLKSAQASIDRVSEIVYSPQRVTERPGAPPLTPKASAPAVILDDVRVRYESGPPVLEAVNLAVEQGERVAVVGPTGAGKTTLLSLIPRFLDPDTGSVRVLGVDVREVQLRSLRHHIALVTQDAYILPLSVADNIAYGRPGAPLRDIEQAAHVADAHRFIQRLPEGYHTMLGEGGSTLSGGQRQRIALARAVLRDAPILILDEPSSALDMETEQTILDALGPVMEGRTTFIIAHRLSTVRTADRIVVLDKGRIVETGTHATLVASNSVYSRLYRLQHDAPAPSGAP